MFVDYILRIIDIVSLFLNNNFCKEKGKFLIRFWEYLFINEVFVNVFLCKFF